jgi:hypothetical protein
MFVPDPENGEFPAMPAIPTLPKRKVEYYQVLA